MTSEIAKPDPEFCPTPECAECKEDGFDDVRVRLPSSECRDRKEPNKLEGRGFCRLRGRGLGTSLSGLLVEPAISRSGLSGVLPDGLLVGLDDGPPVKKGIGLRFFSSVGDVSGFWPSWMGVSGAKIEARKRPRLLRLRLSVMSRGFREGFRCCTETYGRGIWFN